MKQAKRKDQSVKLTCSHCVRFVGFMQVEPRISFPRPDRPCCQREVAAYIRYQEERLSDA